jgi:hypothetical protein
VALFEHNDLPEGDWPLIAEADNCLLSIRLLLKPEHDLTEGRGHLSNAGCIEFYCQLVGRRIIDLTDAISLLWHATLQVPCLIQVRALLETVASANHFVELASKAVADRNWRLLHEQVTKAAFSSRNKEKIAKNDLQETTNIITMMKRLPPSVSEFYEQISDYCHPNGYAMYQRYGDLIDFRFYAMPPDHKRKQSFVAIYNATFLIIFAEARMRDMDRMMRQVREAEPPPRA